MSTERIRPGSTTAELLRALAVGRLDRPSGNSANAGPVPQAQGDIGVLRARLKSLVSSLDPGDPVKTLADIRTLLVGPTRSLHDAMFEEVIDILEESDREIQNALQSLESNYYKLSDITENLITASVETRDQSRQQTELFQEELQKTVAGQQEMLSEMFMAIDAKVADSHHDAAALDGPGPQRRSSRQEAQAAQADL